MATAVGWQAMGKPDFSEVGKVFYRLPAAVRDRCNKSEERMLVWTMFLFWLHGYRSGRNVMSCSVSQLAWAKKFGKSRWTAARALARLEEYGLIKMLRRLKSKDGAWKPAVANPTAYLKTLLGLITSKSLKTQPGSKSAPQEVGNDYKRDKAASLSAPPLVPRQEDRQCLEQAKKLFAEWSLLTP